MGDKRDAEIDRLRKELCTLRQLVIEETKVTTKGEKYWPEWVNKYFDSCGMA
jgi:hypothetical protein